MKESYLYKKLTGDKIQCRACAHYCAINPDKTGICGVRQNKNGKLFSLNYSKVITAHIDPIEKKPLYHFLPGTFTYSIAAMGCNFRCANCQNWEISQISTADEIEGKNMPPEKIVENAKAAKCPSISYTYTEPTIFFELALDTMKIAKKQGLKNIWVSNGYFSQETFDLISPYLDAANIDLKSFSDDFYKKICGARLQPVLDTLKRLAKKKIHLEITTLAIPTLSDDEKTFFGIANFIKKEIGPETPWHISAFSPYLSWKLRDLSSTSVETLEKARRIGLDAGLKNVYLGNV